MFAWGGEAQAQTAAPSDLSRVLELIAQQEARLNDQERQLNQQQLQLSEQRRLIERQRAEIHRMSGVVSDDELAQVRGAGLENTALPFTPLDPDAPIMLNRRRQALNTLNQGAQTGGPTPEPTQTAQATPGQPVGEAPPSSRAPMSTRCRKGRTPCLRAAA